MTCLAGRLTKLEAHARPRVVDHPRLWVIYEGEPAPEDCRAQDYVIRVVYDDPQTQEPRI